MTIAAIDHTQSPASGVSRRGLWAAVLVVLLMTVLRLIYAGAIDLRTDEAYYWTWSKENVLSFLDHPPMIAWFIRFGTAILGDTTLGVRLAGIVAMLISQLLLADIVRRITHDIRAVLLAVLLPEAAVYYGLLMAKVAPDIALIPFALAMVWSLVRVAETDDGRWWLPAGVFGGLALLSKLTALMLLPAVAAFVVVPQWRRRWLASPYPWLAALIALAVFAPVLIWNATHDWASFRFQFVRASVAPPLSLARLSEFLGLQFALVGPVLLPVTLSGVGFMLWRGYRRRDAVAILLSTAVALPFGYFLWRSLRLRVGDTWPMFIWPIGFAAVAVNLWWLRAHKSRLARSTAAWAAVAVVSGIAIVVATFLYYVASDRPWLGRLDPGGAEAGYEQLAARIESEMTAAGATWVAATDYRTYAMLRWELKDRVPVIQINERARFVDFKDPGMDRVRGHTGLYVVRKVDEDNPLWALTSARRLPLTEVVRSWRGIAMETYALGTLNGWTPELSPPPGSPFDRVHPLADAGANAR
ncbi:MAG: glycosyltransferase family 39 protein [Xanthobacteraceae bacterium]